MTGERGGGGEGAVAPPDEALWRRATRDVAPLAGRRAGAMAGAATSTATGAAAGAATHAAAGAAADTAANATAGAAAARRAAGAAGLDRRRAKRLRRGEMAIDGRLDLHGMTREEARGALAGFLAAAQGRGGRCVLVITGKGQREPLGERRSVLRAALPRWLDEAPNRERVLGFEAARPRHGGDGAFYVLLRKAARPPQGGG